MDGQGRFARTFCERGSSGPAGYLWIGTDNGLVRFDGTRFTIFGARDGLNSPQVYALYEDGQGALWIGTIGGWLARLHEGRFTNLTTRDGLAHDMVVAICEDFDGALWVGTVSGLSVLRGGRFVKVPGHELLAGGHVWSIGRGRERRLWIGSDKGIFRMEDGRVNREMENVSIQNRFRLLVDADENLWLAAQNQILRRSPQGQITVFGAAQGLSDQGMPNPAALCDGGEGSVWATVLDRGLFRTQGERFTLVIPQDAEWGEQLAPLCLDHTGQLWLGSRRGLHRLRSKRLKTYGRAEGLPSKPPNALWPDRQGGLWLATEGAGVYHGREGQFRPFAPPDLPPNLTTPTLLETRDGTLWVGTWGQGLFHFQGEKLLQRFEPATGFPDGVVNSLLEDRDGNLWVGTYSGGLARVQNGAVTLYNRGHGLSGNHLTSLAQDAEGCIWVGSHGGGLNRLVDGKFQVFTKAHGLLSDLIRSLHVDRAGTVWIGTFGGGLSRYRNRVITTFSTQNGLADDVISQIIEDEAGHLFLGGNEGIMRVIIEELDAFARGQQASYSVLLLNESDGLDSPLCTGGFTPAGGKDASGHLWFSTLRGLVKIDPKELKPPPSVFTVQIEELAVTGESRPEAKEKPTPRSKPGVSEAPQTVRFAGDSHRTAPTQAPLGWRSVEFRYTAVDLSTPNRYRFQSWLEGWNQDWSAPTARREAAFTRLPPRTYRFRVRATNGDGDWREASFPFTLVIPPFWWETVWFRALAAAAVAGLGFAAYRARIQQLEQRRSAQEAFSRQLMETQEVERKRIAAELHDSLGQNLLIIKTGAGIGLKEASLPSQIKAQLDEITSVSQQTIEEVRNIAYALRPQHLERHGLTKALTAMIRQLSAAGPVQIAWEIGPLEGLFSPAQEMSLFRIVQEILNNVLKHSGASTARVTIYRSAGRLEILIQDDGRGFDPAEAASRPPGQSGFGLTSIGERVRMLGGRWDVVSSPGQGTRHRIEFTIERPAKDF